MRKKTLSFLALWMVSGTVSAFFCPKNFQDIQLGDSLDTVLQKCGKPDSQTEVEPPDTAGPQEWIYNISEGPQGSLRLSVMLQNNRVINLFANGMSMPTTSICGRAISVGDTGDSLKSTCGTPTLINKGTSPDGSKPTPLLELLYESRPPITLVIDHGKLKEKKQGVNTGVVFTP